MLDDGSVVGIKLLVNMYVSMVLFLVCSISRSSVHKLALRMFVYLGSLTIILICRGPLNTLERAMLPCYWLYGGVNELLVW